MGLFENGKIVVRDVGAPDFREHMRRATGRTLLVPALSERVANDGGLIALSNVSPGAAFFVDPDAHGYVYHRSGSHGAAAGLVAGAARKPRNGSPAAAVLLNLSP